jgi:hypothetical protein
MDNTKVTISSLRRYLENSDFEIAYNKLISSNIADLSQNEKSYLLKTAIILLNEGDYSTERLGYRIVLCYSNLFESYIPLYDVSINKGFIPISKYIENNLINKEKFDSSFFNSLLSSYKESFLRNGIYLSEGQQDLIRFADSNEGDFVLIAPTSYGKSDIIVSKAKKNKSKRVCIVVPSKSLLSQTKSRLLKDEQNNTFNKIITHPEMYLGNETSFVAVLTQERLLRLIQKHPNFALDIVLVDEAHNLLKGDSRAILLAQVLLILRKRNTESVFNFFTPFMSSPHNLEAPYLNNHLESRRSTEYIKIEKFFSINIQSENKLELYDQFTNKFIFIKQHSRLTDSAFVNLYKTSKNIVYLNKPRDIESFALGIEATIDKTLSNELEEFITSIAEYIHPEYYLIDCIKKGVLYHHGSMPDIIRLYVENAFAYHRHFDLIITNSTLLEGVDIPADKLFILTAKIGNRYFTKSELKNLTGRICRFSEVFNNSTGSLKKLEPAIYLVKGKYSSSKANIKSFMEKSLKSDLVISDDVDNVLLKEINDITDLDEQKKAAEALEYLENIEPNTIINDSVDYAKSLIAQLCYKNNVHDFDIKQNEIALNNNISENLLFDINEPKYLIRAIITLFTKDIIIEDEQFKRLLSLNAQRYYSMILQWRIDASSYQEMIKSLLSYWESIKNDLIYVGNKWGEINFNQRQGFKSYVRLSEKTSKQAINLAIVRVKEEQDYLDNYLIKYVEIINDLGLIENAFYDQIKYGTDNKIIICLLKNGFTMELAKILASETYRDYLTIDLENDIIVIYPPLIQAMLDNNENKVLIFEARHHLK